MKPRTVTLSIELETDAKLSALKNKLAWEAVGLGKVKQVVPIVADATKPKAKPKPKPKPKNS